VPDTEAAVDSAPPLRKLADDLCCRRALARLLGDVDDDVPVSAIACHEQRNESRTRTPTVMVVSPSNEPANTTCLGELQVATRPGLTKFSPMTGTLAPGWCPWLSVPRIGACPLAGRW
jgi:hypothetical protein